MQVDVLEARGLPRMDTIGSADPFVEAQMVVNPGKEDLVEKTGVKKNTLTPTWNERLWLMVHVS